ncbi:MAG: caspase family protein [Spirochaetes bacterium]|nr:caspase family protein [Spirochaetota bacterium]
MRKKITILTFWAVFFLIDSGYAETIPIINYQLGHAVNLSSAALSNNGKLVLTGSYENTVKLWDVATGKLLKTLKGHKGYLVSLSFSNDDTMIVSVDSYRNIKVWDINSGKILYDFKNIDFSGYVCFAPDDKGIFYAGYGKVFLYDLETQKIIRSYIDDDDYNAKISVSYNKKTIATVGTERRIILWDIATGKQIIKIFGHNSEIQDVVFTKDDKHVITCSRDKTIKMWDIKTGKEVKSFSGHDDYIWSINLSKDGKYLVSSGQDKTVRLWDIKKGVLIKTFSRHRGGVLASYFINTDSDVVSIDFDNNIKYWDLQSGSVVRNIDKKADMIESCAISKDNRYVVTGNSLGIIKIWNIRDTTIVHRIKTDSKNRINSLTISPDNSLIIAGSFKKFYIIDFKTGKILSEVSGHANSITAVAISKDNKKIATGCRDKIINVWEIKSLKLLNSLKGSAGQINSLVFSSDGASLFSGADEAYIRKWDLNKSIESDKFLVSVHCKSLELVNDEKEILAGCFQKIYRINIEEKKIVKTFSTKNINSAVKMSSDGKIVAYGDHDYYVGVIDYSTSKEINGNANHSYLIIGVSIDTDNGKIISCSQDGCINLWDYKNNQFVSFISDSEGKERLIYDSEGYWDASANGGEFVGMVRGLESWNIDQFAARNNRPDIILKRLGSKNQDMIDHFYSQYLKRLKKLGFVDKNGNPDESLLSKDYHVPEAKIVESKINGKFVELKIELSDSLFSLKRYNVFVNDVPLFGAYGKSLDTLRMMPGDLSITEKIELTAGANKIEVSCMNEKGAESYRALTMASYNPSTPVRPDLYYIGFGVSKYIDPDIRQLGFADKDAKDLEIVYSNMKSQYANIYTKTYINEECTVENIKKAKEFLKSAKPDDTFVLFIAGHGIHDTDKEATYYFVTHETKLDNLSQTAANFDIIEDIMQGIAPRNKLFLMDTCESGEIDDEVQSEYFAMAENRGIKSRAIETERALKKKDDSTKKTIKRTYLFEKDRYIYNDLVRRSGAIVFSSCKGGELSYESEAVGNGFFTNKIIESLKGQTADIDKNGIISIDELKNFVIAEVPKLADGKQNPTVDRDNIYQKFGFVGVK